MAKSRAMMPMRLNQRPPMSASRSAEEGSGEGWGNVGIGRGV